MSEQNQDNQPKRFKYGTEIPHDKYCHRIFAGDSKKFPGVFMTLADQPKPEDEWEWQNVCYCPWCGLKIA